MKYFQLLYLQKFNSYEHWEFYIYLVGHAEYHLMLLLALSIFFLFLFTKITFFLNLWTCEETVIQPHVKNQYATVSAMLLTFTSIILFFD